jgi:hypothetical protein
MWSGWVPGGVDGGGTGKLTLSAALSDPFLNFLEDGGDVEGQMVRRCRPHRDFCPALRELSLEDGQRQLGSDFSLPGEDRDHPRFKASFGLPHHALKGRTVRQFGRRLSIAATTDGMQDDGRSVIGELGLAAFVVASAGGGERPGDPSVVSRQHLGWLTRPTALASPGRIT